MSAPAVVSAAGYTVPVPADVVGKFRTGLSAPGWVWERAGWRATIRRLERPAVREGAAVDDCAWSWELENTTAGGRVRTSGRTLSYGLAEWRVFDVLADVYNSRGEYTPQPWV